MTEDQIVKQVYNHLISQGKASQTEMGFCRYRYGTLSCAVGCLIDDDLAAKWDRRSASSIRDIVDAGLAPGWITKHVDVLTKLQRIHDEAACGDEFVSTIKKLFERNFGIFT